jgi:endoribonuclease Dicer
MPERSPIRSCFGLRYPRKALAKRSAAFQMCIELLEGRYLNRWLLARHKKKKYVNNNDQSAVNEKRKDNYVMHVKPSLWAKGRGTVPDAVYLTVIDAPEGLERPHQPIGLITRQALPPLPSFPLFLDSGKSTNVQITPTIGFRVTGKEMKVFTAYTLLLWSHVNAKVFEDDMASMSYWVIPILGPWAAKQPGRDCIDWEALQSPVVDQNQKWTADMPPEHLENKFIVDPSAGNRRFFSIRIDPALKPLDSIPENTAKYDRPGANRKKNILQYSVSLFGKKYDEEWPKWDRTQPVMECTQVLHRQNLLAPPAPKEKDRKVKAFLCPEPMVISAVRNIRVDYDRN